MYMDRVKIDIDTHRLGELCDTEGATEYPLGTLGKPTPRRKEVAKYPLGNQGAHLKERSHERQEVKEALGTRVAHAGHNGPRSHTCPTRTLLAWAWGPTPRTKPTPVKGRGARACGAGGERARGESRPPGPHLSSVARVCKSCFRRCI